MATWLLTLGLFQFFPTRAWAELRPQHPLAVALKLESMTENEARIQAVRTYLERPKLSSEDRYQAAYVLNDILLENGTVGEQEVARNCKQWPPRTQDLWERITCLIVDRAQAPAIRSDEMFRIFDQALEQHTGDALAARIAQRISGILTDQGDYARTSDMLRRALKAIPPGHEKLRADLNTNIAYIYTSPNYPTDVIKEGLRIFDEVEPHYLKLNTKTSLRQAAVNKFNKGITYLFVLKDYVKAEQELSGIPFEASPSMRPDTLLFHSFALAKLGRKDKARTLFQQIALEELKELHRHDFLRCFMTLTAHALDLQHDFNLCTNLSPETQSDVILNITSELAQLDLPDAIKIKVWQQFWSFYRQKIEPEFQRAVQTSIDALELQRARNEAATKDLELKNLEIYRYLSLVFVILAFTLLASFALAVISLRKLNRKNQTISQQSHQIHEKNSQLNGILNSMQEALFQLDPSLTILPGRSAYTGRLFPESVASFADIIALTSVSAATQAHILETLKAIIGENSLAWDLNVANLPSDLAIADRIYNFHWQPVIKDDLCHIMTVSVRDVSELRASQQRLEQARNQAAGRIKMLEQLFLTSDHQQALQLFEELQGQVKDLPLLMDPAQDHKPMLRRIHTFKGVARTLHLDPLKDAAHDLESAYASHDRNCLQSSIEMITTLAAEYGSIARLFSLQHRPYCLGDYVWQVVQPLRTRLIEAGLPPLQCHVEDGLGPLQPFEALVYEIVLHGLTNACDHGYLQHLQSESVTSIAVPFIKVKGERSRDGWVIEIQDNGSGLNWSEIEKLCREHHFTPQAGRPASDILLLDSISTARTINEVSGRGFGLAVIASQLASRGGTAMLLDNPDGSGTLLRCYWPESLAMAS
ncbi:Hpt domain-containing protein [Oligoflexus tunisiensis]|uniref:Hpt domain-containing protein n=1 Tax=Oligoflexus tunisiensis TaxID=708132 RepID=UPI00159F23AA|nr:Hpt domain-containing protein [Oligoflexus tunisiensis]